MLQLEVSMKLSPSPAVLTNGCNNITAILMAVVNTLSHNATTLIVGDGG